MAKRSGNVEWRTMRKKGDKRRDADGVVAPSHRWWTLKPEQIPGAIAATVEQIKRDQTGLMQLRAICARLYGGSAPGSPFGLSTDRLQMVHPSVTGRLTYNLISIVVDSLVSKITKSKVRPMFLTQGGDYRIQRRAKKLSQFADGIFYETKFDTLSPLIFRDACVLPGGGIVHVYEDLARKRVAIERVLPDELYVDEIDGFYGQPTQMHRAKTVDREKLLEAFANDKDATAAIKKCAPSEEVARRAGSVSDAIGVIESWHLPSSPDAEDGRHVIVCDHGVLLEESWKKMRFPFAVLPWKPRIYGWHAGCLAEELIGTQVEMNHLLFTMQRSFRLMGGFKIAVENGTVPDSHFNDKIGTLLHYPKGCNVPQYLTPPALNPQYFDHFERIKQRGFEIARLSQMAATGQSSTGLDASGEARRVQHDIEGEGFQYIGHVFEQFHLDVISLAIDVVRDIFDREKSYGLKAPVGSASIPGQRFLRTIDWKQVKLDEDEYVLKAYPVSSLPTTPQGRLATITDLARAGYIDQPTARKLMDFPDLQAVQTMLGASEDWIMSIIDGIVEEGTYEPPDPLMNLAMAEQLCLQEIAVGSANKMEAEKLDDLRTWLGQVRDLKAKAAAAMAPPVAAAPPGQGAVPGAPPTSDLLPPPGAMPAAA